MVGRAPRNSTSDITFRVVGYSFRDPMVDFFLPSKNRHASEEEKSIFPKTFYAYSNLGINNRKAC